MKLADAYKLRSALDAAIADAEATGSDTVALQAALSAQLGDALDQLEAAIAEAKEK